MRQSASRNQRPKGGFRLKHVLQIFLLLAICTWLLYQVKHSHDKKIAFEDMISKIAAKATSMQSGFPHGNERDSRIKNGVNAGVHEEERIVEVEGRQGQETREGEVGDEEKKIEGDDGIDEQDQDKFDEDDGHEEDFSIEEEEKDGTSEEDGLLEDKEGEEKAREAREENYKRDDASSAVAHDLPLEEEEQKNEDLGAKDSEVTGNVTVNDSMNFSDEALGNGTSFSNISNAGFDDNMNVTSNDMPINGSHLEVAGNEAVDDSMNFRVETLGNGTSLSNISNTAFDDNMTVTYKDMPIDRSHLDVKEHEIEFTEPKNRTSVIEATEIDGQNGTMTTSFTEINTLVNASHSLPEISNGSIFDSREIPVRDQNISNIADIKNEANKEDGTSAE